MIFSYLLVIDTTSPNLWLILSLMVGLGLGVIGIRLYNRGYLEGYWDCAYLALLDIFLMAAMGVFIR